MIISHWKLLLLEARNDEHKLFELLFYAAADLSLTREEYQLLLDFATLVRSLSVKSLIIIEGVNKTSLKN